MVLRTLWAQHLDPQVQKGVSRVSKYCVLYLNFPTLSPKNVYFSMFSMAFLENCTRIAHEILGLIYTHCLDRGGIQAMSDFYYHILIEDQALIFKK